MFKRLIMKKDLRWTAIWVLGMVCVGVWDTLFLNKPALRQVTAGFLNTFSVAFLAWGVTLALHFLDTGKNRAPYLLLTFLLNLIRSVPQVVGILFGYVAVSALVEAGFLRSPIVIFPLLALCISLFVFIEFVDLMRERIAHYQKLD